MVFGADDLAAWLTGLLADAGRKKLTTLVLGTDQERALRSAATAAVRLTAEELRPDDDERAGQLAMVISQVFSEPAPRAPFSATETLLEALEAGIAGQLAVLEDESLTGTGKSSADVLGLPAGVLAQELTTHLLREIVARGARGGPLAPLASQLNHDVTHLQGLRLESMLGQLADEVREALARRQVAQVPETVGGTTAARHVFISYVREDSRQVDRLQRALEAAGLRVWRDTADLWPGEDWRAKIRSAITDDAFVFIACFSKRSLARDKSYQNKEIALAIEQLHLRPPEHPWLIPVRFDDCQIPDREIGGGRTLVSIQRADLFGDSSDEGTGRLVTAVLRILRRQSDAEESKMQAQQATSPTGDTDRHLNAIGSLQPRKRPTRPPRLSLQQVAVIPDDEDESPLYGSDGQFSNGTLAFSAGEPILVTGGRTTEARLWDVRDPHRPRRIGDLRGHDHIVSAIASSSAFPLIATGSGDKSVLIWDMSNYSQPVRCARLTGHDAALETLAFSHDGSILASGAEDGSILVWDVSDASRPVRCSELPRASHSPKTVAFTPDGRFWELAAPHMYNSGMYPILARREELYGSQIMGSSCQHLRSIPQVGSLLLEEVTGN